MGIFHYYRGTVRLNSVPLFRGRMGERHPELLGQVSHDDFLRMAERDGVFIRLALLPDRQHARTFVVDADRYIQLNRRLSRADQTLHGMHELCHIWRDHVTEGAYYSDELTGGQRCEFADIFAWAVTTRPMTVSLQLDVDF